MNHPELIAKLFSGHAGATSSEASLFFQGEGMAPKASQQVMIRAFADGTLRRKRIRRSTGYEYRLASRYPKFGMSSAEEQAARKPTTFVDECRKLSRLVEFNNLIAGVRGSDAQIC